jgi:hypothetical protein
MHSSDIYLSWEEKAQAEEQQRKTLLKTALAHFPQIHHIDIDFDGYGDSGQIDNVTYLTTDNQVVEAPDDDMAEKFRELDSLVNDYAYDLLPDGFEINEGSFGTIHLQTDLTGTIDYNERYEASHYSEIQLDAEED